MLEQLDVPKIPVIMCYSIKGKPLADDMEALRIIQKLIELNLFDRSDFEISQIYGKIEIRKKYEQV